MVDPLAGHPLLASLPGTAVRVQHAWPANAGQALDYVKAPLFDWTLGRVLPPSGSASSDDLQDLLSLYLDQCKTAGGEIYAFGAKFDQNLHKPIDTEFGNTDGLHGIHDIHMNQGNVGAHAGDNGVVSRWRAHPRVPRSVSRAVPRLPDPAHPDRRRRQRRAGRRSPSAQILAARAEPRRRRPARPTIYIERALINPSGADAGREIVVLASLVDDRADADQLAAAGQERARDADQRDARAGAVVRRSRSTAPACSSGTRAAT